MADVNDSELLRWLYRHLSLDDADSGDPSRVGAPNSGDVAPEVEAAAPKPLGSEKEKDTIKDYPVEKTSTSSAPFKEEMVVKEVNPEFLDKLQEMGFAKDRAAMGLSKSGNVTVEAAMEWLLENDAPIHEMPKKDTIKDYPVEEISTSSALFEKELGVKEVNPEYLKELEELGFAKDRAAMGLSKSGNVTVEANMDWLHENDALIHEMPKGGLDVCKVVAVEGREATPWDMVRYNNAKSIDDGFAYRIEGKYYGDLEFGKTNRSASMWGHNEEEITVMCFDTFERASEYAIALKLFAKSPYVADYIYLNEKAVNGVYHVLIDKIDMDMNMCVSALFGKESKVWNDFQKDFRNVFHGICLGLSEVFRSKTYSVPNLFDICSISVDSRCNSKIANLIKHKDPSCHMVNQLGASMFDFLISGVDKKTMNLWSDKALALHRLGVHHGVVDFIKQCLDRDSENNNTVPVKLLLDFPGFWDWKNMVKWVFSTEKVFLSWTRHSQFAKDLDAILRIKLGGRSWTTFIPVKGRVRGVYYKFMRDEEGCILKDCFQYEFYRMIRFFRNVIVHFNKFYIGKWAKFKKSDPEICELMESYFDGGLCIALGEMIKEALFGSLETPTGVEWWDIISPDTRAIHPEDWESGQI